MGKVFRFDDTKDSEIFCFFFLSSKNGGHFLEMPDGVDILQYILYGD